MKARCPKCRKLNAAMDKTSPITCGCGETFTPKFYRKNVAGQTVFYCACGNVALERLKGNSRVCARCLEIERRFERDFIRKSSGLPFSGLWPSPIHLEGFA